LGDGGKDVSGENIPTKPVAYLFFEFSRSECKGYRGVCGMEGQGLIHSVSHNGVARGGDDDDTEVAGAEIRNGGRTRRDGRGGGRGQSIVGLPPDPRPGGQRGPVGEGVN
jgi:hypothetical protein